MRKIKILFAVLLVLSVMALGWWISYENSQIVSPMVAGFELPAWTLGTWLFMMLLVGGVLGYLVSLLSYLRYRGQAVSLRRKLQNREKEIAKLRASGLRD